MRSFKKTTVFAFLVIFFSTPAFAESSLDFLKGSWRGGWKIQVLGKTGKISPLTIREINPETMKFHGTIYVEGPYSYHNRDYPIKGSLSRDGAFIKVKFGFTDMITYDLKVLDGGNEMTGSAYGSYNADITLTKIPD